MPDTLNVCVDAAKAGGEVLRKWAGKFNAQEKGPRDLVTEADLESQQVIREILISNFPHHQFLGEEDTEADVAELLRSEYCWVVDPLDGTANYVHQLQTYAVSIALVNNGKPVVGVIYDPVMDHCYAAERGSGATCNGDRIAVSDCNQMDQAMIAASFSAHVSAESSEIVRFLEVLMRCQALRRLGSAALNLCYLAAGQLDGYWATSVNAWDVAAGLLIVEEAGGVVTALDGGEIDLIDPVFSSASTHQLQQQMLAALSSKT